MAKTATLDIRVVDLPEVQALIGQLKAENDRLDAALAVIADMTCDNPAAPSVAADALNGGEHAHPRQAVIDAAVRLASMIPWTQSPIPEVRTLINARTQDLCTAVRDAGLWVDFKDEERSDAA